MAEEPGIEVDSELVERLRDSMHQGPLMEFEGREVRLLEEEQVGSFSGLTVHIFGREHPPPHVCVRHQGSSASFSIESGERLPKNKGLEAFDRNIKNWIFENQDLLVERWNATRPSDCPVGPIKASLEK